MQRDETINAHRTSAKIDPKNYTNKRTKTKANKKNPEDIQVFIITSVLQITSSYDVNRPCVSKKKSEDDNNNKIDFKNKNSEQAAEYGPLSLDYKF